MAYMYQAILYGKMLLVHRLRVIMIPSYCSDVIDTQIQSFTMQNYYSSLYLGLLLSQSSWSHSLQLKRRLKTSL